MRFNFTPLLIAAAFLVAAVWALYHFAPLDFAISDAFFNRALATGNPLDQWLWPRTNKTLDFWLHDFPVYIFIAFGIGLVVLGFNQRFQRWRRVLWLAAAMLVLVPVTVTALKTQIQAYCPSRLQHYGGYAPDDYKDHVLSHAEKRRANCFPASHPACGFALMIFGILAATRREKILGYGLGISCGAALSLIQIGRGDHFLSHCLATALIALWLGHLLAAVPWQNILTTSLYRRR